MFFLLQNLVTFWSQIFLIFFSGWEVGLSFFEGLGGIMIPPKHSGPPQAEFFSGILDKTLNPLRAEKFLGFFRLILHTKNFKLPPKNFFTSPPRKCYPPPPPQKKKALLGEGGG